MLKITMKENFTEAAARALAKASTKAEHTVAVQAAKDTSPYVPFLTGDLNSGTTVEGNVIVYPGPYARYLYYGKVMVDSATGKGPMHFIDKNGNEVVMFPKGSKLKATDRNLDIKKGQDHWFEASKAQNLEKWIRVAEEAVKNEL